MTAVSEPSGRRAPEAPRAPGHQASAAPGRRPSARPDRRAQILATAAELFARRGFHGVSIDELGAAVGVSGPALYRYFPSKDAMLSEMLVGISERLLAEGRRRMAGTDGPAAALQALIGWHVEFALTEPALITVQEANLPNLAAADRHRVRQLQRRYVETWVDVLLQVLPDADEATARAAAHAVFGLINSTPHSALLDTAAMAALLERMAAAALTTPGALTAQG
jgi:AcrR family transcriptional regulator